MITSTAAKITTDCMAKLATIGCGGAAVGSYGDDTIHGGTGNDRIVDGAYYDGTDWIDGGEGYDTIHLEGQATNFSIGSTTDGWMTFTRLDNGNITYIRNVESFEFDPPPSYPHDQY